MASLSGGYESPFFLLHTPFFDVIENKWLYNISNLIMMQKAPRPSESLKLDKWTGWK